ncbi:MAG: hypothetical protein H0W03_01210 [Solirubrobacterales bacterium]|jgi:hypothetical protein|nr:hypothetical protein [Solirubrobacterales bacterium]
MAAPTTRERAEAKRLQKLEELDEQVRSGSLVVRQMTPEEVTRFGPCRPQAPRRRRF